jgi:hypothetical protein
MDLIKRGKFEFLINEAAGYNYLDELAKNK